MTEQYTSSYAGTTSSAPSTADTARSEASDLKDKATGAGSQLLDQARSETAAVTDEARRQVSDLWSQARTQVADQAGTQQSRLAGGLTTAGDDLAQMASASTSPGIAADVVREVGDRVSQAGRWLQDRGPEELLDEVRAFARRRPGTFLLVAAGAGIVLGRLGRGLKDAPPAPRARTAATTPSIESIDPVVERTGFAGDLDSPVPVTDGASEGWVTQP